MTKSLSPPWSLTQDSVRVGKREISKQRQGNILASKILSCGRVSLIDWSRSLSCRGLQSPGL